MSDSKFAHRRRSAPPARRASWGKRQVVANTPEDGSDQILAGLPTVEEFQAFFSSIRGRTVPTYPNAIQKVDHRMGCVGISFATAEGALGGVIVIDVIAAVVIGGAIRRFCTADIRHCIETGTVNEEVIKALRYMGRRMADLVSSTEGPRLYFRDVTDPGQKLPTELVNAYESAQLRMGFQLDLAPYGVGNISMALALI